MGGLTLGLPSDSDGEEVVWTTAEQRAQAAAPSLPAAAALQPLNAAARTLAAATQPASTPTPVFFLHDTTGDLIRVAGVVGRLGVPVLGVPLTATGPLHSVPALAQFYLEHSIRPQQPRGPYRLAGFSLGVRLALEVARQLEAAGERVEYVLALDDGPSIDPALQHLPEPAVVAGLGFVFDLSGGDCSSGDDEASGPGTSPRQLVLAAAGRAELSEAVDALQALATARPDLLSPGSPLAAQQDWQHSPAALRTLRAQLRFAVGSARGSLLAYRPATPVGCPIAAVRTSTADRIAFRKTLYALAQLTDAEPAPEPGDLGLGAATTGPVHVLTVPGNHFTLLREHAATTAAALASLLDPDTGALKPDTKET